MYMHAYINRKAHTHTRTHAHTHTHKHTHTQKKKHAHKRRHTHTHVQTQFPLSSQHTQGAGRHLLQAGQAVEDALRHARHLVVVQTKESVGRQT